jgi:hypothetical protein
MTQILRYGTRTSEKINCPALDGPAAVQTIKYSRASVGATYHVEARPPARERYDNASSRMLGPEAIRQIVEAIESLDWVCWVRERMKIEAGNNSSVGQPTSPADQEGSAREKYVRTRLDVEQLHRNVARLDRDDRDRPEVYERAAQADRAYREGRKAIADRIRERALRDGVSYDRARELLGEQLPLPILGPPA